MNRILAVGLAVAALLCGMLSFYSHFAATSAAVHPVLVAFRLSAYLGVLVLCAAFIAMALNKRRVGFWLLTFSLVLATIASLDAISRTSPPSAELQLIAPFGESAIPEPSSFVNERRLVLAAAILSGGALLSLVPIPGAVALTFVIGGATIALALALRSIMPVLGAGFTSEGIQLPLIRSAAYASDTPLALWCTLALLTIASTFWSYTRPDIRVIKRFALLSSSWTLWFSGLLALAVGLVVVAPEISTPALSTLARQTSFTDSQYGSNVETAVDDFHDRHTDYGPAEAPVREDSKELRNGSAGRIGALKSNWLVPLLPMLLSILLLSFVAFSGIHAFSLRSFAGLDVLRRLAMEKSRERDSVLSTSSRVVAELALLEHSREEERHKVSTERDALLKEIHHRVKNNLQIIMSFLNLQLRNLTSNEAQAALQESRGRVRSIALIHEVLYRTGDFLGINIRDYVEQLCDEFLSMQQENVHFEFKVTGDPVYLNLDQAIPAGMAVSEIITALTRTKPEDNGHRMIRIHTGLGESDFTISIESGQEVPAFTEDTQAGDLPIQIRFARALVAQFDGSIMLPEGASDHKTGRIVISGKLDVLSSAA